MADFTRVEYEKIERGAIRFLYAGLNDEIERQKDEWDAEDAEFAAAMDRSVLLVDIEPVEPENFYVGLVPTLINAPIDRYPNVSAMSFEAKAANDDNDQVEKYGVNLTIEIMCKAVAATDKPEVDADIEARALVNSRTKRTLAAVHQVMMADDARRLGGIVPKLGGTPNSLVTEAFMKKEANARGPRWFWQAGSLEYLIPVWVSYG